MAGIHQDTLDLGYWDSVQGCRYGCMGYIKISQDILGYLGLGIPKWLDTLRHPRISWDIDILGYLGLGIVGLHIGGQNLMVGVCQDILGYLRLGILGLGAGSQNGWDMSGNLMNSA